MGSLDILVSGIVEHERHPTDGHEGGNVPSLSRRTIAHPMRDAPPLAFQHALRGAHELRMRAFASSLTLYR
jgi:hypothetical protein